MIKDYPDVSTTTSSPFTPSSVDGSAAAASTSSSGSGTTTSTTVTYAPYTPRGRRPPAASGVTHAVDDGAVLPEIPSVASNSTGGITRRVVPASYRRPGMDSSSGSSGSSSAGSDSDDDLPLRSEAKGGAAGRDAVVGRMMQTRVRALDDVQRLGRLVTLDLKGNDLRVRLVLACTINLSE
jgi:protein phosphatase 1 regulatory subunit 37